MGQLILCLEYSLAELATQHTLSTVLTLEKTKITLMVILVAGKILARSLVRKLQSIRVQTMKMTLAVTQQKATFLMLEKMLDVSNKEKLKSCEKSVV